jgi:hypothetical protein
VKPIQAERKLQVVPTVPERLLKSKCTFNRGTNLIAVSRGIHRRQGKAFLKYHLLPGATGTIFQTGKRPLAPPGALFEQRQTNQERCRPSSELYAKGDIPIVRERPLERRPHVADMPGVSGKIVLAKPRLNELVVLEKVGEKLRMPPGNAIPFTSVGKLRLSKDPRRLKQPIICRSM